MGGAIEYGPWVVTRVGCWCCWCCGAPGSVTRDIASNQPYRAVLRLFLTVAFVLSEERERIGVQGQRSTLKHTGQSCIHFFARPFRRAYPPAAAREADTGLSGPSHCPLLLNKRIAWWTARSPESPGPDQNTYDAARRKECCRLNWGFSGGQLRTA